MSKEKLKLVPKADQTFQDILGNELYFPDLLNGEDPAIGDTAYLDGALAEGEFLMPGGETLIIIDGKVDKVLEPLETVKNQIKRINNKNKRFTFKSIKSK